MKKSTMYISSILSTIILIISCLICGCSSVPLTPTMIEPNIVTIKKETLNGTYAKTTTKNGINVLFKGIAVTQEELDLIDKKIEWGKEKGFTLQSDKVFIYLVDCIQTDKYGYQYIDNYSINGYASGEFINQAAPSYCHIIICRQILTNICHELTHYMIMNDPNHIDPRWKQWGVW